MPTTSVHIRDMAFARLFLGARGGPPGKSRHVFIGRSSKWGNPFRIGHDGTRAEVIAKFREWIKTQPELLAALPELKGKTLVCYCAPLACHGDVLAELADAT